MAKRKKPKDPEEKSHFEPDRPSENDAVEPLEAFFESVDADLRTLFRQLIWEIPYERYLNHFGRRQKRKSCSAAVFASHLKLAIADEWWEVSDETLARKLGCPMNPEYLDNWRKTEEYKWLREEAVRGMEIIQKQETVGDLLASERFQTRIMREISQLGTQSKVPWIRQKSLEAVLDRMAPKLTQAKDQGQPQFIIMSEEQMGMLTTAIQESMRVQGDDGEPKEVHSGPLAIAERASGK